MEVRVLGELSISGHITPITLRDLPGTAGSGDLAYTSNDYARITVWWC
jgi:hypothetical protein